MIVGRVAVNLLPTAVPVAVNVVPKVALIAVPDDSYCGPLHIAAIEPPSVIAQILTLPRLARPGTAPIPRAVIRPSPNGLIRAANSLPSGSTP
jgi:hypothetical protein